jgi:hypothetical protein
MLRDKPTGQVGTVGIVDSAIGSYFATGFGCEVTALANNQGRRIYEAVTRREFSWKFTI